MRGTVALVGQKAGGREHIVATAALGDPVLLVPEPDNPYDPNAVAVYTAPRRTLLHPEALVSSVKDPAGGTIHDEDRKLLMDRQAGYMPKDLAARVDLPPEGIVGYIANVRYLPPDYRDDGQPTDPTVAGFDTACTLTMKGHR